MKNVFLVLCLLLTTAAFGQSGGGASHSNQAHPYQPPSHPEHASVHALAAEQYVLRGNYASAQGEKPTWDLPQAAARAPSLGETARFLRKEHAKLKKARIVFEN